MALFARGPFVGQGLGPLLFGAGVSGLGFPATLLTAGAALVVLGQVVVRRIVA